MAYRTGRNFGLAGFLLICGGLVLQLLVLSLEPLTVAQPLQASGVVVTILFSRLLLHERLGRAELACIGVIAVAVALLSLSSGHGPGPAAGTRRRPVTTVMSKSSASAPQSSESRCAVASRPGQ